MPSRPRRALDHVGGKTRSGGDATAAEVLAAAMEAADGADPDVLTHGFHSYPARMHYMVARTLLQAWAKPGQVVLDPFCGSGTVLIEGRRAGVRAVGIDLNPVACRLATIKVDRRGAASIATFEQIAAAVVAASLQRVEERVAARAPVTAEERQWYPPHVLRELAGLHAEIEAVPAGDDRDALRVVLSAIAVKFSRQRADTSEEKVEPNVGKGTATRFFGRKAEELATRWRTLAAEIGARTPRATVHEGDMRELPKIVERQAPFDLVLTSPPYGGTYDYVEHHARRYPWLGVSAKAMRARELGARRNLSHGPDGAKRWDAEVGQMLATMRRIVERGRVVLLIGDGQAGGQRIDAREQLTRIAPASGLGVVAWSTQTRPDFAGGPPRAEHLLLLQRA